LEIWVADPETGPIGFVSTFRGLLLFSCTRSSDMVYKTLWGNKLSSCKNKGIRPATESSQTRVSIETKTTRNATWSRVHHISARLFSLTWFQPRCRRMLMSRPGERFNLTHCHITRVSITYVLLYLRTYCDKVCSVLGVVRPHRHLHMYPDEVKPEMLLDAVKVLVNCCIAEHRVLTVIVLDFCCAMGGRSVSQQSLHPSHAWGLCHPWSLMYHILADFTRLAWNPILFSTFDY